MSAYLQFDAKDLPIHDVGKAVAYRLSPIWPKISVDSGGVSNVAVVNVAMVQFPERWKTFTNEIQKASTDDFNYLVAQTLLSSVQMYLSSFDISGVEKKISIYPGDRESKSKNFELAKVNDIIKTIMSKQSSISQMGDLGVRHRMGEVFVSAVAANLQTVTVISQAAYSRIGGLASDVAGIKDEVAGLKGDVAAGREENNAGIARLTELISSRSIPTI